MMLEPAVIAPVLSQPSLPLQEPDGLEISDSELRNVRERLEKEDLTVLGLRFDGDLICRKARFDSYSAALGDRFVARTLPDSAAADTEIPPFHQKHVAFPHSVLTVHFVDEEGSLTRRARDEVLAFLAQRLRQPAK